MAKFVPKEMISFYIPITSLKIFLTLLLCNKSSPNKVAKNNHDLQFHMILWVE